MAAIAQAVTTDRKNPKTLVGNFTFAKLTTSRQSLFPLRNIRQFLVHHADKLSCNDSSYVVLEPQTQHSPHQFNSTDANEPPVVDGCDDLVKPVVEAASHQALVVRTMKPDFENSSRRSTRRLQEAVHHNDNAELALDIVSIRKKLNFKTNRLPEDGTLRKKIKSGHIKCTATLTVWDNRTDKVDKHAAEDPLVTKQVNCVLVSFDTDDNIPNVSVQLDEPFRLRANDLKVCLRKESGDQVKGVIDDYFVEMKLFPTEFDEYWPPIPYLGKSDGDSQKGVSTLTNKLKGVLLVRYLKLPQAPEPDVPLSIFFIEEGQLRKTKYGLEIKAEWTVQNDIASELSPKLVAKVPSRGKKVDSSRAWFEQKKATLTSRPRKPPPVPGAHNGCRAPPAGSTHRRVTVSYVVDPASASQHGIDKELRTFEIDSFGCPVCVTYTAENMLDLRFHFLTMHSKYNFVLREDGDDAETDKFLFHIMPVQQGRSSSGSGNDMEFSYVARRAPFDLSAYVNGDRSWTREGKPKPRAQQGASSTKVFADDPLAALRKQNGGHLALKDVPDFRAPQRKKHPVIHLDRKTDDKRTSYSSISHRPRSVFEDDLSETDDEIDDEWFIGRHLENLDILAKRELCSDLKAEVIKRWSRHRLEEKLTHSRFLSDSLVRFVRKEKEFLRDPDMGMRAAVSELLAALLRVRFIQRELVENLRVMIYGNTEPSKEKQDVVMADVPLPPEQSTSPGILKPSTLERQATMYDAGLTLDVWKKQILALPSLSCGVCTKVILLPHKEEIHCSKKACVVAGAVYHRRCVKQKRDQKEWTCHGCKIRALMMDKGKGKARAVD